MNSCSTQAVASNQLEFILSIAFYCYADLTNVAPRQDFLSNLPIAIFMEMALLKMAVYKGKFKNLLILTIDFEEMRFKRGL